MTCRIRCSNCHEELISKGLHDMRWCSCGKTARDGGDVYTRLVFDPEFAPEHWGAESKGWGAQK